MIVLNLTYTMKEGKTAADFVRQMEENNFAPLSRADAGNHCFRFFFPADGENQVFLLEKWENDELLAAHKETEHFSKIMELESDYVANLDVQVYVQ